MTQNADAMHEEEEEIEAALFFLAADLAVLADALGDIAGRIAAGRDDPAAARPALLH